MNEMRTPRSTLITTHGAFNVAESLNEISQLLQHPSPQKWAEVTVILYGGHEERMLIQLEVILGIREKDPEAYQLEVAQAFAQWGSASAAQEAQESIARMAGALAEEFGQDED